MGTSILKGVTTGLLVTVLTLFAVLAATMAGVDKNIMAYIVDFGLLLSCLAAGYRASRSCARILPGAVAAAGYAIVGILLLALYFPIDMIGALKIISEGTGLGLLAGVLGAGVLSSDPDPYDRVERMDRGYYPRREQYYDHKDIYDFVRPGQSEQKTLITTTFGDRRPDAGDDFALLEQDRDRERTRIYELCSYRPERDETEEAFDWWEVEAKRQLRGK